MHIRIMRSASLKQRVFSLIVILGIFPILCLGLTAYSMVRSESAGAQLAAANKGALYLAHMNGDVYAVVMESRGIYMAADWHDAEPFAKRLMQDLTSLRATLATWRQIVIESERSKIDTLDASLDQFVKFRGELVRLAREETTANARIFGDNEENRKVRQQLNDRLNDLEKAYLGHEGEARAFVDQVKASNLHLLVVIAILTVVTGGIGAWFVHRTVIMLVNRMRLVMMELAAGNLEAEFTGVDRTDEIGDFARAFAQFKNSAKEKLRLEADAKEQQQRIEAQRSASEADRRQSEIAREKAAAEQTRAVTSIGAALAAVAQGNLTIRLNDGFTEDYRQIQDDFNLAVGRLQDTIGEIAAAAKEVANATGEISASTTDLSQRTEEQAASLEQTSASMEQISATVKKNAENAQAANQSATDAREIADRSGRVVVEAVDAVAKIEESSRKISDIIGVIDEIARQTNLLALNAAVEAARAGDAGRGFAVVATEVRTLAQRSSQAAKDIKDLIATSSGQVRHGVELVNKAGTSLSDILETIKTVATRIADVANASAEQAMGLEQVNLALTQMDEVTQQNSALVEQNVATAKILEFQANAMDERVAFFKFDNHGAVGAAATPAHESYPERLVTIRRPDRTKLAS